MNQNVLLTGGRILPTLSLVRLFSAAGYRVFVADSWESFICSYSTSTVKGFLVPSPRWEINNYLKALKTIIKKEEISLLIPTFEEIFYLASYLEELSSLCQVFTTSFPQLKQLHNKWNFSQKTKALGLLYPKTWLIKSRSDLVNCLRMSIPSRLIIKPVYSRFASDIYVLNQPVERLPKVEISEKKPWILQEFIPGQEYSTYSVAHEGKLTAHVTYLKSVDSLQVITATEQENIFDWVSNFLEKECFTGQIAFDFIVDEYDDIYPLDCNLRVTEGVHLFHPHDDLVTAFLNSNDDLVKPRRNLKITNSLATMYQGFFPKFILTKVKQGWQGLTQTQDQVFRLKDPLPNYVFFKKYLGCNNPENFVQDLEWNGEIQVEKLS